MQRIDGKYQCVTRPIKCKKHGEQVENGFFGKFFGCPVCSAEVQALEEIAQAKKSKIENYQRVGLPKMFFGARFGIWQKTDEEQIPKLKAIREYSNHVGSKNLVLSGSTGTGKTLIASCLAFIYAEKMLNVKYTTSADFVSEIRETWDSKKRGLLSEKQIIDGYANRDVLIIDEVGVADKSSHDLWSALIDGRYRSKKQTIITTNLTMDELKKHIGDRAMDRLMHSCLWVNCVWKSFRVISQDCEVI